MTPSWSSRCDLGEPTWFSFISWSVSAIRAAIWSSCRLPVCRPRRTLDVVLGRRRARPGPASASRRPRGPRGTWPARPAGGSGSRRRARRARPPGGGRRPTGRPAAPGRSGPRPRPGTGGSCRSAGGSAWRSTSCRAWWSRTARPPSAARGIGTVCLVDGRARPSPRRGVVRSTWRRSAASPRSSVAAMVSGIVATGVTWPPTPWARSVTRGSRSLSRPSERNVGLESGRSRSEVSWISRVVASRSVQRAANVFGSTRSSVGGAPGWTSTRVRAIGSVPTRVSSTSVSGRKIR